MEGISYMYWFYESWKELGMLETFGYLGYALWVSLSGKGKTFEGKENKRRGFQGEVQIS